MFGSVLIANRGEIACRIMRTARRLGMRTIAVYSEADASALHVREADEAHLIGPAPATRSYLDAEKVLDAAARSGAECIHPGYGFLSENAAFAEACAKAGIAFVGPPADAIRAMGLKDAAKALMEKAGVPVVPGYHGEDQDDKTLSDAADDVGFPVLIKAVAGGGGKGMRRVEAADGFEAALASCRREAQSAFGDDRVLIERFVTRPRHIEIQVFADTHGNCVHLFERDCSLQRRHQKVIEEAPAPGMTPEMRERMGQAAVAAAQAVGYVGAGTVEFIADSSGGLSDDAFFFMEMNTRLQVEHPVTEMITGTDLVEWQFRAASGETLPKTQDEIGAIDGHAAEARLYAEDPGNGFLPQTGHVASVRFPEEGDGIRVDTGIASGDDISPYYDPMIAKIIAHGASREQALAKLRRALSETVVLGVRTNAGFLENAAAHPAFVEGGFDTGFIDTHLGELVGGEGASRVSLLAAHAWFAHGRRHRSPMTDEPASPWGSGSGWTLGTARVERAYLLINGKECTVTVRRRRGEDDAVSIEADGEQRTARVGNVVAGDTEIAATLDGETVRCAVAWTDRSVLLAHAGAHFDVRGQDLLARADDDAAGGNIVRAPMSGKLIRLHAEADGTVKKGQALAVLEAMKMEHTLVAGADGKIAEVSVSVGDQVDEGETLIVLDVVG